jgi:hypothetical protein
MRPWRPGEVIVRRELWRGRPSSGIAALVVRDEPGFLAVYVPEGAPMRFPEGGWPGGLHPWHGHSRWRGHGVLMLHRPDDAYAVWVFWHGADRAFSRWYLNLQAPLRRTSIGFDTLDHELDLWSPDGDRWLWKDDELLSQRVQEGRFTASEAAAIRAEARRLEAELGRDGPWWDLGWGRWTPDPSWPWPALPPGWEHAP